MRAGEAFTTSPPQVYGVFKFLYTKIDDDDMGPMQITIHLL